MDLKEKIQQFQQSIRHSTAQLIAVSKTQPIEILQEAYQAGLRVFGENRVQELVPKYEALPKDIHWHLIGTLQTNKVKYIASFVKMIHSVESLKLLKEIDKQASKNQRIIDCLLQIHIAEEETKFGLSYLEAEELLTSDELDSMEHIRIVGVMGMATFTQDTPKIRTEFKGLKQFFDRIKATIQRPNVQFSEISMGMSNDYLIALEEGSTLIRVGSAIFGERNVAD